MRVFNRASCLVDRGIALPLAVIAVAALLSMAASATELNGKPRIIDGDSIVIGDKRIRLHGIDTPEAKQTCQRQDGTVYRCGDMATFALAELIEEHWVTCKGDTTDRYGRLIGVCVTGPVDLNAEMVRRGWALAYRRYSTDYVDEENDARAAGRGIWQGRFVPPWEWRRGKRLDAVAAGDQKGCRIKGNVGRGGKRFYHIPGGRWYDQTNIDRSKGERWFCTEAEAREAGWRRSAQ